MFNSWYLIYLVAVWHFVELLKTSAKDEICFWLAILPVGLIAWLKTHLPSLKGHTMILPVLQLHATTMHSIPNFYKLSQLNWKKKKNVNSMQYHSCVLRLESKVFSKQLIWWIYMYIWLHAGMSQWWILMEWSQSEAGRVIRCVFMSGDLVYGHQS